MTEALELVFDTHHLVAPPDLAELRRSLQAALQLPLPQRIAHALDHCRAEEADHPRQRLLAVGHAVAPALVGQRQVDAVAVFLGDLRQVDAHQPAIGAVVAADVETGVLHHGRQRVEGIEDGLGGGRGLLADRPPRRGRRGQPGEVEQVVGFRLVAQQGPGDGSDHLLRSAYRAALLQPGVPGHADPGELRHLLATQARRASAAEAGNADPLRLDAFPPAAQEGPQLFGAGRLRGAFRSVAGRGVEGHGEVLRRADG